MVHIFETNNILNIDFKKTTKYTQQSLLQTNNTGKTNKSLLKINIYTLFLHNYSENKTKGNIFDSLCL